MSKFIEKIKLENPNLNEIDIRHHPMEKFNALNTINKKINSIIGPIIKVNILNNTMSISEIGCNYKIAFGMMSSALFDARASCEKIKVYCIKSLSMGRNDLDNNYFLKLLNEDIIFFDDDNDQIDQNYLKYKSLLPKVKKQDFMEFIKSILL